MRHAGITVADIAWSCHFFAGVADWERGGDNADCPMVFVFDGVVMVIP